ncbi:MAG: tRNA (guanosine(37)-N1)-methyltransferase TrmD [Spirochaetaceae bacterium]|jgi:tRNA (guanine37-N1)-methyltransferase|nr:tRNA (guanosine(37)-N1)-methyltransferase TrmD [Spirochaetaceae bacterium]GMO29575.1 MAG: tRNA (guanosine(37)-N1)-methyltransferase TrmD [Termitinemataceae bacterium]
MTFTVLTLFPEIINAYIGSSIMARAIERGLINCRIINIRDFAFDKHKSCDDAPYGGGAGMLLLPEPLALALKSAGVKKRELSEDFSHKESFTQQKHVIYLSPSGILFDQKKANKFSKEQELVLICGRYEGIDKRIIDLYVDEEISTGDYVLSSGEIGAMVIMDAVHRLVEGVITCESLKEESFSDGLLEYPQWTRPEVFDTLRVPEILLSGHHERIRHWRLERRIEKTAKNRPDLLEKGIKAGIFSEEVLQILKCESNRSKNERD